MVKVHTRHALITPLLLALALLATACAATSGATNPAAASTRPTATVTSQSAMATATATASVSPSPSQGSSSAVALTLDKSQYQPEDPLLVTIHNNSRATIWVQSGKPGCPSLVVEYLTQASWQQIGNCAPTSPAANLVAVAPGSVLTQRLDATTGANSGAGWPQGTYRVMLRYASAQDPQALSAGPTVYSAQFAVA